MENLPAPPYGYPDIEEEPTHPWLGHPLLSHGPFAGLYEQAVGKHVHDGLTVQTGPEVEDGPHVRPISPGREEPYGHILEEENM